jgi:hypothetical protein
MVNGRRTQPYRKGVNRPKGRALSAMLAGAPKGMPNPQDRKRRMAKRGGKLARRMVRM